MDPHDYHPRRRPTGETTNFGPMRNITVQRHRASSTYARRLCSGEIMPEIHPASLRRSGGSNIDINQSSFIQCDLSSLRARLWWTYCLPPCGVNPLSCPVWHDQSRIAALKGHVSHGPISGLPDSKCMWIRVFILLNAGQEFIPAKLLTLAAGEELVIPE